MQPALSSRAAAASLRKKRRIISIVKQVWAENRRRFFGKKDRCRSSLATMNPPQRWRRAQRIKSRMPQGYPPLGDT